MNVITSPANHNLTEIRRLRQKKERVSSGLAYIEGLRIVTDALRQSEVNVQTLIYSPELLTSKFGLELVERSYQQGMEIWSLSASAFGSISLKDGPQGIAALIRQSWTAPTEINPSAPLNLILALHEIADPGNLGTILRTADAVGCHDILLIGDSTDPYDPTAIRASMGTLFAHHIARLTAQEFIDWQASRQIPLVATSDQAEADYHGFSYPDPLVLLMGSERQGLPQELMDLCQNIVRIPMNGIADSLNLSVATAVFLYEIYNHRRSTSGLAAGGVK